MMRSSTNASAHRRTPECVLGGRCSRALARGLISLPNLPDATDKVPPSDETRIGWVKPNSIIDGAICSIRALEWSARCIRKGINRTTEHISIRLPIAGGGAARI
jgi:hypothetical protein